MHDVNDLYKLHCLPYLTTIQLLMNWHTVPQFPQHFQFEKYNFKILLIKWIIVIVIITWIPAQEKFCEIKNILKICVAHLGYFSIACSGDNIQFRIEYTSSVIVPNLAKQLSKNNLHKRSLPLLFRDASSKP